MFWLRHWTFGCWPFPAVVHLFDFVVQRSCRKITLNSHFSLPKGSTWTTSSDKSWSEKDNPTGTDATCRCHFLGRQIFPRKNSRTQRRVQRIYSEYFSRLTFDDPMGMFWAISCTWFGNWELTALHFARSNWLHTANDTHTRQRNNESWKGIFYSAQ